MHIKQITISNFRSFRQQPEIQPFSPATNCVVGRNGSGKSNLFDAVQFVLMSPRFATLRSEERQALLHEGSGSAAVNAFVEVVFDNSDHRFSLEHSDEVVLRRTVGSKKDEFFLQRKRATKQEVQSLLEGAGFSKSNPYFMVQQGKIQTLCLMSDVQRLELLQQVAGTTLYEDKKAESLLKMQENSQSVEKINSILGDIDARLEELKGEKEELTVYQTADRTRKALEYTLYDKELKKARHTLDTLEHDRMDHLQQTALMHEQSKQTHEQIQNAEALLQVKSQALRRNHKNLQNLEQDKLKGVTRKTQLDLNCQELQEQIASGKETLARTEQDLAQVQQQIDTAQESLKTKSGELTTAQTKLTDLLQEKDQASRQADALYAKQGRSKQYNTKEERDLSLTRQIQELQAQKNEKQQQLQHQQDALANLRRMISSTGQSVVSQKQQAQQKQESLQGIRKSLEEKQKDLHQQMDVRKHSWRQAEELQESCQQARADMQTAMQTVRKSMPRATAMGLKALQRIVQEENLSSNQYFGMVMENLTLKDPKYQTAVEVAAQNALFHVIVDTDATAAKLMEHLETKKLGRVTFMPLNRLRSGNNTNYPQSNEVTCLLDMCIDYDPRVEKAMQHVFDKKLLAKSAEIAAQWSSRVHMDCITLDGDLCSRKGALTGGYLDQAKSRLKAYQNQVQAQTHYNQVEQDFRKMDAAAKQAEQDVTNASQEVSRLENKQSQLARLATSLEHQWQAEHVQLGQSQKQTASIETQVLPPMEREIAALDGDVQRLQEEIGTELTSTLTDQDRAVLRQLKESIKSLQNSINTQGETVEELRSETQKLESLLEDNLLKRRQELKQVFREEDDTTMASTSSSDILKTKMVLLEDKRQLLADASKSVQEFDKGLEKLRSTEESLKHEMIGAKQELDKLKTADDKNLKLLDEANLKSEKLMSKKSMNVAKRENYMRKIQELGSLPPPRELVQYKNQTISELEKALEKVNKKLKKYSHVNKKAFDQYVNFNDQRENLLQRKEELDKGAEKVKELVESLDRKKDEAINRTFRGVSKHFAEVFKELVPLGEGELIMRTSLDDATAKEDGDTDSEIEDGASASPKENSPDVSLYRGVGIKVRFSKVGENFIMSQLSGGQKALVALALIFAIQRCDPAPFYIFDELDQALDSTYRQAVANVISRQATSSENPTQFIVSTFRPELVAISKNCYGISHQNKVSSIHPMGKNDALRFIANLMSEEEAVGEVTNINKRKRKAVAQEAAEEEASSAAAAPGEGEAESPV